MSQSRCCFVLGEILIELSLNMDHTCEVYILTNSGKTTITTDPAESQHRTLSSLVTISDTPHSEETTLTYPATSHDNRNRLTQLTSESDFGHAELIDLSTTSIAEIDLGDLMSTL